MHRTIALLFCGCLTLATDAAVAQEDVLSQLYGNGVHEYFAGNYQKAHGHLTAAISGGSRDPRVYYYRGLAYMRLGREADAADDFEIGAQLEMRGGGLSDFVGRSLTRVQGSDRMKLESHRTVARVTVYQERKKSHAARFGDQVARPGAGDVGPDTGQEPLPPTPDEGGPAMPDETGDGGEGVPPDLFGEPDDPDAGKTGPDPDEETDIFGQPDAGDGGEPAGGSGGEEDIFGQPDTGDGGDGFGGGDMKEPDAGDGGPFGGGTTEPGGEEPGPFGGGEPGGVTEPGDGGMPEPPGGEPGAGGPFGGPDAGAGPDPGAGPGGPVRPSESVSGGIGRALTEALFGGGSAKKGGGAVEPPAPEPGLGPGPLAPEPGPGALPPDPDDGGDAAGSPFGNDPGGPAPGAGEDAGGADDDDPFGGF